MRFLYLLIPFDAAALHLSSKRNIAHSRRIMGVVQGIEPPVTSHLSLVPSLLAQTLRPGDVAVDCTAGIFKSCLCF